MKSRKESGFALLITILTLGLLFTLAVAMYIIVINTSKGSFASLTATEALYNARAGIAHAEAAIEASSVCPPSNPNCAWTGPDTETWNNGKDSFTVTQTNETCLTCNPLLWEVQSTGSVGTVSRTITAVLSQVSFAKYGYISNFENLPEIPPSFKEWWIGGNVVEGPLASNGFFNFYDHPEFSTTVTSANGCFSGQPCNQETFYPASPDPDFVPATGNTPMHYQDQTFPSPGDADNPAYFYHYFNSYTEDSPEAYDNSSAFSFQGGQSYVPWPITNPDVMPVVANMDSSLAIDANLPTQVVTQTVINGVTVTTITGDVKVTLNGDGTVTLVTGGLIKSNPGTAVTYSGGNPPVTIPIPQGGGTLYIADGNVMLSGTVNGQLTIATGPLPDPKVYTSSYNPTTEGTWTSPAELQTLGLPANTPNDAPTSAPYSTTNSYHPDPCTTPPSFDGAPPSCGNVDIVGDVLLSGKTVCTGSDNSTCNTYTGTSSLGIVTTGDTNIDPYSVPANVEIDASVMAVPETFVSTNKVGNTTTTMTYTINPGIGVIGYAYACQNITTNINGISSSDGGAGCGCNNPNGSACGNPDFCYLGSCPPAEKNFYLFGGMMPELGGDPVGIFNSGNGQIVSGYNQMFYYNSAVGPNLPPNFPFTGHLQIMEWTDSNAL